MFYLESDRLYFKLLDEDHFEDYAVLEMDPVVMKYIRNASETKEHARESFTKLLNYNATYGHLGGFSVFEKSTQRNIGLAVLIHIELNPVHEKYEVGYKLEQSSWGKGYATEITKAFLKYSFGPLGFCEIYGTIKPENIVSEKVLLKAGLKECGPQEFRIGNKIFVILREEHADS